jgi:hypothetical protein
MTIGRDLDFTDWQMHRAYDAIEAGLLDKDAPVGINCEDVSCDVLNDSATGRFFVLNVLWDCSATLEFRPAVYVTFAVRKKIAI